MEIWAKVEASKVKMAALLHCFKEPKSYENRF